MNRGCGLRRRTWMKWCAWGVVLGGVMAGCVPIFSVCPAQEIESWLEALNDNSWMVRENALENIRRSLQSPESGEKYRTRIEELRTDPHCSFEARKLLESLNLDFKSKTKISSQVVSSEEVLKTLDFFFSESPAEREAAEEQLRKRLEVSENTRIIVRMTREAAAREEGPRGKWTPDDILRLERLERDARNAWLENDLRRNENVDIDQLRRWVETVAEIPLTEEDVWASRLAQRTARTMVLIPGDYPWGDDAFLLLQQGTRQEKKKTVLRRNWAALHELEDSMTVENLRDCVIAEIQNVLAKESKPRTAAGEILLNRVLFLNEPCLAAEYWNAQSLISSQFVQIGVPQVHVQLREAGMDEQATHFEELRENTVRCVRGKNLKPGVLPLNRALLHPTKGAFFFLVSLDSPRKKLMYPAQLEDACGKRRDFMAESTMRSLLAENRRLTLEEWTLLEDSIPPEIFSRYAGEWLRRLEDGPLEMAADTLVPLEPVSFSHHGKLCYLLALRGTSAAVPALLDAIREKKVDTIQPYGYSCAPYLALFEIARRDPWPGMESWLESLLEDETSIFRDSFEPSPMMKSPRETSRLGISEGTKSEYFHENKIKQKPGPTVASMAAEILCDLRGIPPEECGLRETFLLEGNDDVLAGNHAFFPASEDWELAKKRLKTNP